MSVPNADTGVTFVLNEQQQEVFAVLCDVIASKIWWYQGGADEALEALLERRKELILLLGGITEWSGLYMLVPIKKEDGADLSDRA